MAAGKMKRVYKAPRKKFQRAPIIKPFGNKTFEQHLVYCDYIQMPGNTGGNVSSHVFSANSLYDPDYTGIGHQPHYFDQCMAIYDHYTVYKAKITIYGENNVNNTAMITSLRIGDDATLISLPNDVAEQTGSKWIYVSSCPASTDNKTKWSLSKTVNVPKFFTKTKKDLINDAIFRGAAATSPAEQVYFIIDQWAVDQASGVGSDFLQVKVEYWAQFTEPKIVLGS